MYPLPGHFLVRPSADRQGVIVPLIAADQLPDWIQLAGVPRELDAEQAVGLTNVGLVDGGGNSTYEVRLRTDRIRAILNGTEGEGQNTHRFPSGCEKPQESDSEESEECTPRSCHATANAAVSTRGPEKPDQRGGVTYTVTTEKDAQGDGRDSEGISASTPAGPKKTAQATEQDEARHRTSAQASEPKLSASRHNDAGRTADEKQPPRNKEKSIRPHLTEEAMRDRERERLRRPGATAMANQRGRDKFLAGGGNPDTIYCRHWCHHGTCKWGWGCRYQHRMPTNLEGLREVGLRDFPTWYLLMMGAGGFPAGPGGTTLGGLDMNVDMSLPTANDMLSRLGGHSVRPHPAEALVVGTSRAVVPPPPPPPQQQQQQHAHAAQLSAPQHQPSPMDLRLMQGRMSALLSGSTAMSNRQKLRQIREMRELLLRPTGPADQNHILHGPSSSPAVASLLAGAIPHAASGGYYPRYHQGRANLHTNASVAANAAGLSAASRRHAVREAERGANLPVEMPDGAAGEGRGGRGGELGSYDELEGRLSPVSSEAAGGEREASGAHEVQLLDFD